MRRDVLEMTERPSRASHVCETIEQLDRLIAFPSVSQSSNLALIDYIADCLQRIGASHLARVPNKDRSKAGLLARIGPDAPGGIMLSAHSDVVPVAGQLWTKNPFEMERQDGRCYGRGTADMKGFLASMLTAAQKAAEANLNEPLLLCVSYDEEVGCVGMQEMSSHVIRELGRPRACIVGEPTSMQIATGHKGKLAARLECTGVSGHSSMAPQYLNAIHLACDAVGVLRQEQLRLRDFGTQDNSYDVAYSTVHAGIISGGLALNIVPAKASVDFEIRHLYGEDPQLILDNIAGACRDIEREARQHSRDAGLKISVVNSYPGFEAADGSAAVEFVDRLLPQAQRCKVAFGTEAGFFDKLQIPTVVCGPGSMSQGHQPDEYIEAEQLRQCDAFLGKVIEALAR